MRSIEGHQVRLELGKWKSFRETLMHWPQVRNLIMLRATCSSDFFILMELRHETLHVVYLWNCRTVFRSRISAIGTMSPVCVPLVLSSVCLSNGKCSLNLKVRRTITNEEIRAKYSFGIIVRAGLLRRQHSPRKRS